MKKAISLIIAFVLLAVSAIGCSNNDDNMQSDTSYHTPSDSAGNTTSNIVSSDSEPTDHTEETTPTESDFLDPNVPLFYGDTYNFTYVYVNAYGEILNEVESPLPYYSENGLAAAYSPVSGKIGFVDKEGVFVINAQYDDAGPFSPIGLAPVACYKDDSYYSKWGFINEDGEIVIPLEYDKVSIFTDTGYAVVAKCNEDGEYAKGVIDTKGNICIPLDVNNETITLTDEYVIIEYPYGSEVIAEIRDYSNKTFDTTDSEYDTYEYLHGTIYKLDYVEVTNGETTYEYPYLYYLDGDEFKKCSDRYTDVDIIKHDYKQVSTTKTGHGYKLTYKGEDISSYEYDIITTYQYDSRYLLAYKFHDERGSSCTVDIYDQFTGEQTAYDIPWGWAYYSYEYVNYLPDGYFVFHIYEDYTDYYGVVDHLGNMIMSPVYEGIVPYTYDYLLTELLS